MSVTSSSTIAQDLAVDVLVMPGDDAAWDSVCRVFRPAGLTTLRRFEAIDGARLAREVIRESLTPRAAYELSAARRRPYGWVHEGVPSRGAIGCYLSHLELWKQAARRAVPTLILEQDAVPSVSPIRLLDALAHVPPGADVALLGHLRVLNPFPFSLFTKRPTQGFHPLRPTLDVFGTHAYVVTPAGARKLADRALPINTQVDCFLRFLGAPDSGVRVFYHAPSLVRQRRGSGSGIQVDGTTWDDIVHGGLLATRAVLGATAYLVSKSWSDAYSRLVGEQTEAVRRARITEDDSR